MEPLRVLVVEDDNEMLKRMVQSLERRFGETVQIYSESDFDVAVSRLRLDRYDVVVLDVRRGEPNLPLGDGGQEAGRRCYDAVRAVRFVPVVFHTGLPEAVRDLESAVVSIVAKGGSPAALPDAVEAIVTAGLPRIARAMMTHVERVHRDYMWEFGAQAWALYGKDNPEELVHLLARRLALSFEEAAIDNLRAELTRHATVVPAGGLNPVRLYILPPLSLGHFRTGDIFASTGEPMTYWILLTPTCDIVPRGGACKVEEPVLARCTKLTEFPEFSEWRANPSNSKKNVLRQLLKNNRSGQAERYFFLPSAFILPDLIVDLSAVSTIPRNRLCIERGMRHLATLDEPFAASMLTQFIRYFGRFGTADLDVDLVLRRLEGE